MRILQIILISVLLFGCNDTGDAQNQADWREEYGLVDGLGAIQGQLKGEIGEAVFKLVLLDPIDTTITVELSSDNKFIIINLLSGYYDLKQYSVGSVTLLDSIPVRKDSITVLKAIPIISEPYPNWITPPIPPNILKPMQTDIIKQSKWVVVPISYLKNEN